jgi:hypothetical protein
MGNPVIQHKLLYHTFSSGGQTFKLKRIVALERIVAFERSVDQSAGSTFLVGLNSTKSFLGAPTHTIALR